MCVMAIGHTVAVGGLRCGITPLVRKHAGMKSGIGMGSPPRQKRGDLGTWSSPTSLMEAGHLAQEGIDAGRSHQGGGISNRGHNVMVSRRGHALAGGEVVARLVVKAFQGGSMFLGTSC